MEKLRLNESELQNIIEKKVFKRVCESVIHQDGDKWKIKGKGNKDWNATYDSKEKAEQGLKAYFEKK